MNIIKRYLKLYPSEMWFMGYAIFGLEIPFYLVNGKYIHALLTLLVTIFYNWMGWKFYRLETDMAINTYIRRI